MFSSSSGSSGAEPAVEIGGFRVPWIGLGGEPGYHTISITHIGKESNLLEQQEEGVLIADPQEAYFAEGEVEEIRSPLKRVPIVKLASLSGVRSRNAPKSPTGATATLGEEARRGHGGLGADARRGGRLRPEARSCLIRYTHVPPDRPGGQLGSSPRPIRSSRSQPTLTARSPPLAPDEELNIWQRPPVTETARSQPRSLTAPALGRRIREIRLSGSTRSLAHRSRLAVRRLKISRTEPPWDQNHGHGAGSARGAAPPKANLDLLLSGNRSSTHACSAPSRQHPDVVDDLSLHRDPLLEIVLDRVVAFG